MSGSVVAFYSFKGGVGRSFTLANIAVLLARWGHRVLCIDWDLEAPGLHHYFRPLMSADPAGGVVDLVDDFLADRIWPARHTTRLTGMGKLDLIAAGRDDLAYPGRVQAIDWDSLYDKGFGDYLERCREQWTAEYDFILLDSRTGISDVGGICTAHLPDRLVVLFTANVQSMDGAVYIAERADVARDRMPYDRPRLTVLPVLSRFDARDEYARADEWRRICLDKTKGLFSNWLDRDVPPELMSRHLTLPYVSYWTFGEELPVRAEPNPTADQISYALETVAAVIGHHFDRTDLLAQNRDAYVAAVRAENRTFTREIRVSTPRSTLQVANELVRHLETEGVHAELSLSGERTLLAKTDDGARHLCLIVDQEVSRWQAAEVELFLHRTLGQDRRLIPVLTAGTEPNSLPGYIGNLRYLRLGLSRGPAEVARGLVEQLTGVVGLVDAGDVDLVTLMRQVSAARLRPRLWELVDELVEALTSAVGGGDDARAQELGADLTLAIRRRATENGSDQHVGVPPHTQEAIEWVERFLGSRHQFKGNLRDQTRAGEDLG
ncbi:CobQ/CobB/MinD/ParA nucleotide binding domain-containing protein [Amycolatopsis xylanica]|uniref:CobQ/CobB/MinD/ParA nucleotide binding domain-containing protein n=1 Tax=Amycolatopsis xylanica TaxID=589385 RepID=A0A1H2SS51_9PSEU|nr:CATRA system-associated protein [Amycolatopsis xylanica]SDW33874.1 CobQ/CobB/MinD/ParA nucleotide binding domain-containing protein [Amycolatopsis xylanica]